MAGEVNSAAFWKQILARDSSVGRYSGPEQHDLRNLSLAAPQTVSLLPFSLMRPIESIVVVLKGRITVTVGAYADLSADSFANLVQRFTLRGTHNEFGSQVPWDMSGASTFVYPKHFQQTGGQIYTSVGGGALTLAATPGVPFTSAFTGTVATHDFIVIWHLPMTPLLKGQSGKRQQTNYLLYRRNWNDSLQLDIALGDASALGDPTGATTAFTAFQSATGTPQLQTLVNYGSPGPFEGAAAPGVVIRNEQMLNNVTTAGAQIRLMQLQKYITNAIVLKAGTLEVTGQTAGITTFDTYNDLFLDKTQLLVDGKQIRRVDSNFAERAYLNRFQDHNPIQGFFALNFIEAGNALTAYRADTPDLRSADIALFSDLVGVGANDRVTVIQELVRGGIYADV
jgi:hypothetical protein